jgi:hypothetical protein
MNRNYADALTEQTARLRDGRFFSLAELKAAIRTLVDELNGRLMRKLGASRREFFESIDQPVLMPLLVEPHQNAKWLRAAPGKRTGGAALRQRRVSVRPHDSQATILAAMGRSPEKVL